jgi:hypothetical protein
MLNNKLEIFTDFVIKVSKLLFFQYFLILFLKIKVLVDISSLHYHLIFYLLSVGRLNFDTFYYLLKH